MSNYSALLVDDDTSFRDSVAVLVKREGFEVAEASNLAEARARLGENAPDVVILDLGLPDGDGSELLREATPERATEYVVVTGNASIESAVQAMRDGALDYLTKPIEPERLKSILAGVVRTLGYKLELRRLSRELRDLGRYGRLVGRSAAMQQVYDMIARVAPTQATVLLTGASGTGKELAAETIHLMSGRRSQPFLAINCGAISKALIESELFGHERGSFTGAEGRRRGYFEQAHHGTLFLDEVSEMPLDAQSNLLRVLETGTLLRVGGSEAVQVDVRVVAATNADPQQAIAKGQLREDLFYRLNVFPISMPLLAEREDDIDLLADHFLEAIERPRGHEARPDARVARRAAQPRLARKRPRAEERGRARRHPERPRDRGRPGTRGCRGRGRDRIGRHERHGHPGGVRRFACRRGAGADSGRARIPSRRQAERRPHARHQPEDALHAASDLRSRTRRLEGHDRAGRPRRCRPPSHTPRFHGRL